MQLHRHRLLSATPGTQHELVSLHFGPADTGRKAYLQASLHADEVPAMLVAHHLRLHLQQLDAEGRLRGEVVLVPAANPVGLGQQVLGLPQGRFDLATGENFNRGHADLSAAVFHALDGRLGGDAAHNARLVRAAAREACAALPAPDMLASLRRTLLGLAIDADTVLDLHCDNEAALHLYTATPAWSAVQPLAQRLGAAVTLLATDSGGSPFDEACSMLWPRLAALFDHAVPLPADGCVAVTVELRGEADVSHALAERDAAAIIGWLADRGFVDGEVPLPAGPAEARPLAGSMPVKAPHGGVLVHLAPLGAELRAGEPLAELIDPLGGASTIVSSPVDGLLYARASRRYAHAGTLLAKVAGHAPQREGNLLSA